VVELALEQALEQRAALELVRSSAARRLMSDLGRIAALLRRGCLRAVTRGSCRSAVRSRAGDMRMALLN